MVTLSAFSESLTVVLAGIMLVYLAVEYWRYWKSDTATPRSMHPHKDISERYLDETLRVYQQTENRDTTFPMP